jgi:hypothetical protein
MLEDASLARGNQDDLFLQTKMEKDSEPAVDYCATSAAKINPDTRSRPREETRAPLPPEEVVEDYA